MSDGAMILLIFSAIIVIPVVIVLFVLAINKRSRRKKFCDYTGVTGGTILKIKKGGVDCPFIIHAGYVVNGVNYEIKETAKLKSQTIKIGPLPIGQKKTFVLGNVREGDTVEIHYDETNPQKGIIYGNEGLMTD